MKKASYDINQDYSDKKLSEMSRYVKSQLGKNTLSSKTIDKLLRRYGFDSVVTNIAKNPILNEEQCGRIFGLARFKNYELFSNKDINPLVLRVAMRSPNDGLILLNILKNPRCPVDIIEKYFKSHRHHLGVISCIIENSSTPTMILKKLYKDKKLSFFHDRISDNPNAPEEVRMLRVLSW